MLKSTTITGLVNHLSQTTPPLIHPDLEALCTNHYVMLDPKFPIPSELESVTVISKSAMISRTFLFENSSFVISALRDVELSHILHYLRFVSCSFLFFTFFLIFYFVFNFRFHFRFCAFIFYFFLFFSKSPSLIVERYLRFQKQRM